MALTRTVLGYNLAAVTHSESDVSHFLEAAGSQALDELVRLVHDAAHSFAIDAAGVLDAE